MCNQFESITMEIKEPDFQETRIKLSSCIETKEHGQEYTRYSCAIGMQLCNLANTTI